MFLACAGRVCLLILMEVLELCCPFVLPCAWLHPVQRLHVAFAVALHLSLVSCLLFQLLPAVIRCVRSDVLPGFARCEMYEVHLCILFLSFLCLCSPLAECYDFSCIARVCVSSVCACLL
jgi:hypothetical protein